MGRIVDRLFLYINSIVLLTLTLIAIALFGQWVSWNSLERIGSDLYENQLLRVSFIVTFVLVLLFSVRLLFVSIASQKAALDEGIGQQTELGDVRISMDTIHHLSLKAASRVRGLSDIKSKARYINEGITITLHVCVDGHKPIPQLTDELQQSVKSYIEEISGIHVPHVSVIISNVSSLKSGIKASNMRSKLG